MINRFRQEFRKLMEKEKTVPRKLAKMSGIDVEIIRKILAGDNSFLTTDLIKRIVKSLPFRSSYADEAFLIRVAGLVDDGKDPDDVYAHWHMDCLKEYPVDKHGWYWYLSVDGGKLNGPFETEKEAIIDGRSKTTRKDKRFLTNYFNGKKLISNGGGTCVNL